MMNVVNSNIQMGLIYSLGGSAVAAAPGAQPAQGGGGGPSLACCGSYILNDGATLKVCALYHTVSRHLI